MNNFTKAIFNGDFDESLSSDDDIMMMQLLAVQQQKIQALTLNQPTRHVVSYIQQVNEYFIQTHDAIGAPGLSSVQKMTTALRILQYSVPVDAVDEYIKIDKTTATTALNFFTRTIVAIYEGVYLRFTNEADVARLLQEGEQRGFPGISLNDITVLDKSHLFSELTRGRAFAANYTINNQAYTMGYYLANDIYSRWTTIVKTISQPQGLKRQLFARMQEACQKDVERAFRVLQARFNIVRVPVRGLSDDDLYYLMKMSIIFHNMVIEDERNILENQCSAALLQIDTTIPHVKCHTIQIRSMLNLY
ncbi:uncharacterized protein LOC114317846 [Camellia sinensis]|uniref:uncharacterized protein LOC114317846 n=1 Tax=Camellia sinensis TaxID=4442 RepID=UPI001035D744|nr:uncharacterized protein LOC114317846 [Camellia sinensis]